MYTGTYRIAGRSIAIESQYPDVHAYCAAYRHAGEPDFTIRITPADIDRERDKSAREDQRQGIAPRAFPEGYLEELAVYRQIADRMPAYDTLLIHGSAIALDGAAYLFTARSGTGKSTHTRFWRQTFGSRAVMINDDKPLVGLTDAGAVIYGTPYNGKHRLGENLSAPLHPGTGGGEYHSPHFLRRGVPPAAAAGVPTRRSGGAGVDPEAGGQAADPGAAVPAGV